MKGNNGKGSAGQSLMKMGVGTIFGMCFVLAVYDTVMFGRLRAFTLDTKLATRQASTTNSNSIHLRTSTVMGQEEKQYHGYQPAAIEDYLIREQHALGLDVKSPELVPTCRLWEDDQYTPYYSQLHDFVADLDSYNEQVKQIKLPLEDLRQNMTNNHDKDVCDLVKLHPEGVPGLFPKTSSGMLSYTASGWSESLLPPMRHPRFCTRSGGGIQYLVHDFYHMCQKLKPTTRTVFVDMGASLSFHANSKSPVLYLLDLYRQFGIKFDHIYGYEVTRQEPADVFQAIPPEYKAAYHWINLGVQSGAESDLNPLKMILDNYQEDDLIIVKLDIDTAWLEREVVDYMLNEPKLHKLIDHFYFEHHVNQKETVDWWGKPGPNTETVAESLELFYQIRKLGIASHFWV